jgi:hypothetical protein
VLQPLRVAHGHHRLALLEGVGVAQRQGAEVLGVDAEVGEIAGAVVAWTALTSLLPVSGFTVIG